MIINLYVETLLTDKVLADRVWKLWDAGLIPDELAAFAWWVSAFPETYRSNQRFGIFWTAGFGQKQTFKATMKRIVKRPEHESRIDFYIIWDGPNAFSINNVTPTEIK